MRLRPRLLGSCGETRLTCPTCATPAPSLSCSISLASAASCTSNSCRALHLSRVCVLRVPLGDDIPAGSWAAVHLCDQETAQRDLLVPLLSSCRDDLKDHVTAERLSHSLERKVHSDAERGKSPPHAPTPLRSAWRGHWPLMKWRVPPCHFRAPGGQRIQRTRFL